MTFLRYGLATIQSSYINLRMSCRGKPPPNAARNFRPVPSSRLHVHRWPLPVGKEILGVHPGFRWVSLAASCGNKGLQCQAGEGHPHPLVFLDGQPTHLWLPGESVSFQSPG